MNRLLTAWGVLCGRSPSKMQVMQWAHDLGMHGRIERGCDDCFTESYQRYAQFCSNILTGIGKADQIDGFLDFLQGQMAKLPDNLMILHKHPAYVIARYLAIGYDTPEFWQILQYTSGKWSKL